MTGDVFAALRNHTILARLMTAGEEDAEGFSAGVQAAKTLNAPGELLHAIFMTRTLGLFDRLTPAQLPEYLSGLLIGAEILAGGRDGRAATVIGSPSLTKRYCLAGEILGFRLEPAPADCAALGQFALGRKPGDQPIDIKLALPPAAVVSIVTACSLSIKSSGQNAPLSRNAARDTAWTLAIGPSRAATSRRSVVSAAPSASVMTTS